MIESTNSLHQTCNTWHNGDALVSRKAVADSYEKDYCFDSLGLSMANSHTGNIGVEREGGKFCVRIPPWGRVPSAPRTLA